ncbi:hypothetical protein BGW80DRAFT_671630 [Lactifluus volemus]|nr:hypothetical protein BGW80DRAFT_671630 [Lactifluus volemus]
MQASHGQPPHGATPSPTDRTNAHIPASGSFRTSESIPPSPSFFSMNPMADQRLTGSVIPYQPVDHHPLSPPTYQETVPWQYPQSWDTPVLDAGAPSENAPSTSLHLGGMVSASSEGSTFASSLPPATAVQTHGHYFGSSQGCPYPASPSSGSPRNARDSSLRFGTNVSAGPGPVAPPHLPQGTSMQSFTSPDIWPPHGAAAGVAVSPAKPTVGLVTSLGENMKGKGVQRRSPTESLRANSRYDPVGRQSRSTPRLGTASEPLTDEGEEERDSDGSVRDVRDKKRRYAKTFRDIEKQLFEKLRHRLFPQDPHAKRSECLERAIEGIDELFHLRDSDTRQQQEIESLRQKLADAERTIERLYRELNGRSLTMGN